MTENVAVLDRRGRASETREGLGRIGQGGTVEEAAGRTSIEAEGPAERRTWSKRPGRGRPYCILEIPTSLVFVSPGYRR